MPRFSILFALAMCGLAAASCSRQQPGNTTPSPSPTALPTVPVPAVATPAGAPAVRTPTPSPPEPARTSAAHPVSTATVDPPPKILSISLSGAKVHSGETLHEEVIATPNTASVEARIGGYSMSLSKTGVGTFVLDYKVPFVPFFMHGGYDVMLIARNTEGVQSRRTVRISVE